MTVLLDVNALIALVDSDHVGYEAMHRWYAAHGTGGWATCPLTENGMVRVLSQPSYASGQRTPSQAIGLLRVLKEAAGDAYEFWADDVSLSDASLFEADYIIGAKQVADAYLLGLAARRGGKLVSFDRSLPWQAIRDGSRDLIEVPV